MINSNSSAYEGYINCGIFVFIDYYRELRSYEQDGMQLGSAGALGS